MSDGFEFRPTIQCPCDETMLVRKFTFDAPPEGETAFNWTGQVYCRSYDRCEACGHWFGKHTLDLSQFYEGEYVEATYGHRMGVTFDRIVNLPRDQSDNTARRERLVTFAEKALSASARPCLLDVGSGLGVFPYVMKAAGWNCTALDPDPQACAHISDRIGVPALVGDFLSVDVTALGTYDVVSLNKVIEHVQDPCAMLRTAGAVTNPDGFVYVEVPDGDAAALEGQFREEFFVEHHHVFSAASLSATIERANLQVARLERLHEPSGKFTLACFAVHPTARRGQSHGL